MSASATPNDAQDQTGFINRIFKYFYAIHAKGRELKAKNRKMYYLSKWALFLALISAILLPSIL